MRTCGAPGCDEPAKSGYARYCSAHATALRRHGDVAQTAITKAHLKPYFKLLAARRAKNEGLPLWASLDQRWQMLAERAAALTSKAKAGVPHDADERKAAEMIVRLAKEGDTREIVDTVLAMFMMWELEPRKFRSDKAFRAQLALRLRGVGDVFVGLGWDNETGKERRRYRELTPRVSAHLSAWAAEAFGTEGVFTGGSNCPPVRASRIWRVPLKRMSHGWMTLHHGVSVCLLRPAIGLKAIHDISIGVTASGVTASVVPIGGPVSRVTTQRALETKNDRRSAMTLLS